MAATPKLQIVELQVGQQQSQVGINEMLNKMDVAIDCHVKDQVTNTPPSSPVNGDTYLVAVGGTGAWFGFDGQIASYWNGWIFIAPWAGFTFYDEAQNTKMFVYTTPWVSTASRGTIKSWAIA
jgi:hypothetical protein